MKTRLTFSSPRFAPAPGELDDTHDDFINEGLFAKELATFLVKELAIRNVQVRHNIAEDWGRWLEVEHDGSFTMAIGCGNYGDEHLVFVDPAKPFVRKMFKKIPVETEVTKLVNTLHDILQGTNDIENIVLSEE